MGRFASTCAPFCNLLVVATLERSEQVVSRLVELGIERDRLVTLRS